MVDLKIKHLIFNSVESLMKVLTLDRSVLLSTRRLSVLLYLAISCHLIRQYFTTVIFLMQLKKAWSEIFGPTFTLRFVKIASANRVTMPANCDFIYTRKGSSTTIKWNKISRRIFFLKKIFQQKKSSKLSTLFLHFYCTIFLIKSLGFSIQ